MKFSVIIPLYNKQKHIERAIKSVLSQTYQNFEIIVVDDGSTDDGLKIVKQITDSRIKVVKKKNEGVSSARNKGIELASNDYIGLLDADDSWKPSFLASIYNLIDKYPDAGAYATAYEFIGEDSEVKSAEYNIDFNKGESDVVDYFKGSLKFPLISASSVVIPKHVFKNLGFFSLNLTRGEDLDMWCRIALNYQVVFLNESLASYFLNTQNRSNTNQLIFTETFMSRTEKILAKEQAKGNDSLYFEEYMISRIIPKARYFINNNKKKEAKTLLKKYKHTKYNKKLWFKTYLLSFRPVYYIYKSIKKL